MPIGYSLGQNSPRFDRSHFCAAKIVDHSVTPSANHKSENSGQNESSDRRRQFGYARFIAACNTRTGLVPVLARNGQECLERAITEQPKLILMDIRNADIGRLGSDESPSRTS
jgi:hypothetical protein